ncbi:tyrosine-type recombinase/integrase [Calothrix sp. FACHB-1219]|uniref:site-specific integrase n=1 Tax=unclassified Calothrix TaxID=2619626 RepID=UPI001683F1B3|nr:MULTISPECIES: tyrosine-type recombinase/integrase [unclassified Calothrix]MBD2201505.1 tyrosine-type recombinase/integrase [Calothrix sp. FACHB-168]MBD2215937.1 tyrosine-type recombinase/integrase [Calothrix sp. FACHB-1219]
MVNSAKTPTGKTPKGQIGIRVNGTAVIASFPRTHFTSEKNQVRKSIGISPASFDPEDKRIKLLQQTLQVEMESGKLDDGNGYFNEIRYQQILKQLGFINDLKVAKLQLVATSGSDQLPPKPQLSLLEIWDMYCEFRSDLKGSTFNNAFKGAYLNFIKSAIKATNSEDALKIRNWLVANRNLEQVKRVLSHLSHAYQIALQQQLVNHNPYEGLLNETKVKGAKGKKQNEIETEVDDDVLDKSKAYTWEEVQLILEYIENNSRIKYWYPFVKFKFLTGCRTGEAIGFMWCDVLWDKQQILIRRTYDRNTKSFYNTKTAIGDQELIRIFPMPQDGELWNLLKSIPQGELNDVVFKSKQSNTPIDTNVFHRVWAGNTKQQCKGIIPTLREQGKLTKYLSPYNTRHTFITHQIFDLGRDEKIVSAWCGHGEMVSQKHYQDIADRALQINPEIPANQQSVNQQSELELLREQVRKLQEKLEQMENK